MNSQGVSRYAENNDLEPRLRTCETCGVGMETMAHWEYLERFVKRGQACPVCGKPAVTTEKRAPVYLQTVELAKRYSVSSDHLSRLIREGALHHVETDEPNPGMPRYFVREDEVAAMFPRRGAMVDEPVLVEV